MDAVVEALPLSVKAQVFREINSQIPTSDYGIPQYLYRADIIPGNLQQLSPVQRLSMMDAATLPISMEHGYPAVVVDNVLGGLQPMWERLPGESLDAFNAFVIYLELPENSNHENPVRLLPLIAAATKRTLEDIASYAHIYYWHIRSRAYDLYLVACHRKQREQRLMSIEGSHFKMAEELLSKVQKIAMVKLDQTITDLNDPDADTSDVKLKDLIDMTDKLVKVQRISVGLPAAGPIGNESGNPFAPVEDTLRQVASDAQTRTARSGRSAEMQRILTNPDDLEKVQELVVRIGLGVRSTSSGSDAYDYDRNVEHNLELEPTDND